MPKHLRISVVIPAYNEGRYIRQSLESLAKQTVMPDEVLVVDNNSTDNTVAIAKEYPFVRVVTEARQGSSFACFSGFEKAQGEIIGRIDADNILPANWCETLVHSFEDPRTAAVVGACDFYNIRVNTLAKACHWLAYHHLQKLASGTEILWGTNMGIRASAWQTIRKQSLQLPQVDEDISMSLLLHQHGLFVARNPRLKLATSLRQATANYRTIKKYLATWPVNYKVTHSKGTSFVVVLTAFTTIGALLVSPFIGYIAKD